MAATIARIDRGIDRSPAGRWPKPFAAPYIADRALCIYTSGTTGLPKAANVSHYRLMQWSHWFAGLMNTVPGDRMYNCLPMYHSVGGVVATGAALVGGGAVVMRERFSASPFWDDIARWDCTLFQYIGELCRYLLMRRHAQRRAASVAPCAAATGCARKSGRRSIIALRYRESWSFTRPPKATSRSTIARKPAPSAVFPRSSRIAFR